MVPSSLMADTATSSHPRIPHAENPARIVWALAWPAVALNSLQVVNTLLDRFFVGHLPESSLTALGGATSVMFLMFSLAMALATGATAIVARAFGAGDQAEFRAASRQAFGMAWMGGLLICAITVVLSGPIASLLLKQDNGEAIRHMGKFLLAYGLGLPAIFVIQTLAGSLRGIGDTKSPMVISGLQILLHITLNCFLIFPSREVAGVWIPGADMGIVGAATALSASAWVSAIIYVIYSGRTPLGQASLLRLPNPDWMRRILRVAVPAATMAILRVLSLSTFTFLLNYVPNSRTAIAALPIAFGIESVMFMPSFGLAMAASALVGQSLGMKDSARAERLAWTASHHGALVTLALSVPIYIFAPNICGAILADKTALISETVVFLRWLCCTEVLFAYAMVIVGAMQGAGDTTRPLIISVVALWGMRVPLAYILAILAGLGSLGAWISMALTQGVQGVLCLIAFKQGKWKTKKV